MNLADAAPLAAGTEAIEWLMAPLRPLLDDPEVTELVVNQPNSAIIERGSKWHQARLPHLTLEHLTSLAQAVATYTRQPLNESKPLLGATLPTKERCQFVLPPAIEAGCISLTIRKPSTRVIPLEAMLEQRIFDQTRVICDSADDLLKHAAELSSDQRLLTQLLLEGRLGEFTEQAVHRRLNIVVSGATGSGKTTFMKAILQLVNPFERIITIEDAREIFLPKHANVVHLLYSKSADGANNVDAMKLLASTLRMRPDRIVLAEVREGEAYEFVRSAASGHPGSITSMHAPTHRLAFEQLALMFRQHQAGTGLSRAEALTLLRQVVDAIFVYHKVLDQDGWVHRRVSEIYYRPTIALQAAL